MIVVRVKRSPSIRGRRDVAFVEQKGEQATEDECNNKSESLKKKENCAHQRVPSFFVVIIRGMGVSHESEEGAQTYYYHQPP